MVKRRLVLATTLALFGVAACQLVLGLDRPTEFEPVSDAGDAGRDSEIDAGGCVPSEFPGPKPDTPPPDSKSGSDVYYQAVRSFSVGGGANLDCVDTVCSGAKPPASSCVPREGADICDELGGVDNQVGRVLRNNFLLDDEQLGAKEIESGQYGQVVVLKGYNGLPNDEKVGVGLAPSPGFFGFDVGCPLPVDSGASDADSGASDADSGASNVDSGAFCIRPGQDCEAPYRCCGKCVNGKCGPIPLWDGCDKWLQDSRFSEGSEPKNIATGYVRDSVLYVPPIDKNSLPFQLGGAVAILRSAGLIGQVERFDDLGKPSGDNIPARRVRLRNARIFGRVSSAELLEFVSRFRTSNGACLPFGSFVKLRAEVCASQDISRSLAAQGGVCDAFSLGLRFETEAAERGTVATAAVPDPCLKGILFDASVSSFLDCP
jgi:hypothetical protein